MESPDLIFFQAISRTIFSVTAPAATSMHMSQQMRTSICYRELYILIWLEIVPGDGEHSHHPENNPGVLGFNQNMIFLLYLLSSPLGTIPS